MLCYVLELSIHGVRVCDDTLQWTTDPFYEFNKGDTSIDGSKSNNVDLLYQQRRRQRAQQSDFVHALRPPTRDSRSVQISDVRINQRVEQLMMARTEAMARGESSLVNNLTLELYCSYNVGVNDHTFTWSVGGQFLVDSAKATPNWQPPLLPVPLNVNKEDCSSKITDDGNLEDSAKFPVVLLFGDEERNFDSQRVKDLVQE